MKRFRKAIKKIGAITAIGALVGVSFLGGCATEATIKDRLDEAAITCGPGTVISEDGKVCLPEEVIPPVMIDKEVTSFVNLWSDEYGFDEVIELNLGDNKVVKLMDDKVEVDDEEYDVAEYLVFGGIEEVDDGDFKLVTSSVADKEMEGDSYLHVGENGIRYEYRFEDALPELDEDLTIKFLGKDLKIVEFSDGEITLKEANSDTVGVYKVDADDKVLGGVVGKVKVTNIGENTVIVDVDGVTKIMGLGDTETVNDVEISIDMIHYVAEVSGRQVELTVGEDILRTVKTGDSYDPDVDEEDSEWLWDIGTTEILDDNDEVIGHKLNEVALKYNQLRKDVDSDSDFKALAVGDELILPNDYLRVKLAGTNEPDYLTVDLYDKEEGIYKLVGNFVYDVVGSEDYDKVYLSNGEFYEDFSCSELIGTELKLDDTEATLTASLVVDDVTFVEEQHLILNVGDETHELLHLDTEFVEDETVMTPYGVKFINSEDWVDNDSDKLTIKVPEEKLEGNLVVGEEVTETISVPKEPEVEETQEE